uniref:Kinesin-like protein unc-104 n=1 Tax=Strongyloides stercoralis TaxID=6248 RepID=A0AAF5DAJ2_STRER
MASNNNQNVQIAAANEEEGNEESNISRNNNENISTINNTTISRVNNSEVSIGNTQLEGGLCDMCETPIEIPSLQSVPLLQKRNRRSDFLMLVDGIPRRFLNLMVIPQRLFLNESDINNEKQDLFNSDNLSENSFFDNKKIEISKNDNYSNDTSQIISNKNVCRESFQQNTNTFTYTLTDVNCKIKIYIVVSMSSSYNFNSNQTINNEEDNRRIVIDQQSQENGNAQSNQAQRHVIYQDNLSNVLEFNNNEINGDLETSIDLTDYAKYIPEDGNNQLAISDTMLNIGDITFLEIPTEVEIVPASSEINEIPSDINIIVNSNIESSGINTNNNIETFDEFSPELLDEFRAGYRGRLNKSESSSSLVEISDENISIRSKLSDDNEIENIEKITTYAIIETKKLENKKEKNNSIQTITHDKNIVNNDIVVIDKLSQLELSDDNESAILLENHSKNNENYHKNKENVDDKNVNLVGQALLYLPKIDTTKSGGVEIREDNNTSTKYTNSLKECEKSGKCSCCTIL